MRILIFTNDWPEYFDEFAPAGPGGLQNIVFYSTLEKKVLRLGSRDGCHFGLAAVGRPLLR